MFWKKQKYFIPVAVLMLSFSVLCLETVPKATSVQPGRLVIGSRGVPNDGIDQKVHDEHAGDTKGYQSNQPPFTGSGLVKLLLRHWSPSVWCDKDSMTLQLQGSQVPKFLVKMDEDGPVPLLKMPSQCGYSVKRARRDVSLVAKYDGCNFAQQGNTYILPLSILGVPVKLVCPVPRPVATVSCNPSAMDVKLGLSPDAVRLKVNGEWQFIYQASTCGFTWDVVEGELRLSVPYTSNCWQFQGSEMLLTVQYMDGELILSCPATVYTATGPLPANMQSGSPIDAPLTSTTTATPARYQQAIKPWLPGTHHPYGYGMPWYLQYGLPVSHPVTPTNEPARYQQAIKPWFPGTYHPSGYGKPWYLPNGLLVSRPITTTAAPASDKQVINPWLPGTHSSYGYGMPWYLPYGLPVSRPVPTTAAPGRYQQAIKPWLPGTHYSHGYGMPWNLQYGLPVSAPVTTTAAPRSSDQLHLYPELPITSSSLPVSGSSSGVQQTNQAPKLNASPNSLTPRKKPGCLFANPSKFVSDPGHLFPLQVNRPGK